MIHSPLDPYEQATTIAKYQPDPSIYLDHVYLILELDSSTENTDLNTWNKSTVCFEVDLNIWTRNLFMKFLLQEQLKRSRKAGQSLLEVNELHIF